jgi:hypothetical protein
MNSRCSNTNCLLCAAFGQLLESRLGSIDGRGQAKSCVMRLLADIDVLHRTSTDVGMKTTQNC